MDAGVGNKTEAQRMEREAKLKEEQDAAARQELPHHRHNVR